MSWVQIIVLAIVQGLTEFLPISSTAHLKIVPSLLGWNDPGAAFTAVLQVGTLVAVGSYFWRDIVRILRAMWDDLRRRQFASSHDAKLGWMIAIGTLPIVVLGVAFRHQIKTSLRSLYVMSAALAGVALLLAAAEWWVRRREEAHRRGRDVGETGWRDAIVVGCAQAAALIPGTSRSGATILGGLASGLTREAAARFSFLLSIPSIFAAGVFELIEAREDILASTQDAVKLVVGVAVAGIVGYASIPWLLAFLRTRTTLLFIIYRLALAAILLGLLLDGRLAP
ncbi:MAG: undecaprenyl-diphosphatase UppP [Pirellulales bacterium]|nr:undecaprenyl-diphosphatase UppP [Pirellulales bacterium]